MKMSTVMWRKGNIVITDTEMLDIKNLILVFDKIYFS